MSACSPDPPDGAPQAELLSGLLGGVQGARGDEEPGVEEWKVKCVTDEFVPPLVKLGTSNGRMHVHKT